MPTALILSPHLDDAPFSCGGLMALLADAGWRTCMATAFTRTIHPASGFALACQLDKGLPPDVDYMEFRRAEDREAAAILGVTDLRWLDLPEAPHRGYDSAAALFGPVRPGDDVWQALSAIVVALAAELEPDLVLAPQGLGNHVDHRQAIRAVRHALPGTAVTWFRDTPYAIRYPDALPDAAVPSGAGITVPIGAALERKVAASCAYTSQIGFQFGGAAPLAAALRRFAVAEGNGLAAERFTGDDTAIPASLLLAQ